MRRLSLLLCALLLLPSAAAAKDIVADLVVHRIEITSGFSGAELTLFGAVNDKGDAVAVVRGPTAPGGGLVGGSVEVRQKTRTLGIWMTGAHVTFNGGHVVGEVGLIIPGVSLMPPTAVFFIHPGDQTNSSLRTKM